MQTAQKLQQEVQLLREALDRKNHYILQLEEALKQQRQHQFGASSEKVSPDQLGLFNEAEALEEQTVLEEATVTVQSHTRQKKPRVSIPSDLPREDIIHDLLDSEKVCPHDGTELTCIGSDDHEQLDIIPAQIKVIRHKRLKYACPCCDQILSRPQNLNNPLKRVSPVLAY